MIQQPVRHKEEIGVKALAPQLQLQLHPVGAPPVVQVVLSVMNQAALQKGVAGVSRKDQEERVGVRQPPQKSAQPMMTQAVKHRTVSGVAPGVRLAVRRVQIIIRNKQTVRRKEVSGVRILMA